ncbi:paraquat-inducible protein A [Pontivivens ytuae]|uniref:Paraquat-inducible protein A n=1 Tax=Pontivivens ytuae TaxID=2789856 RepID=A0A7S9QAW4_9RHOB|nr:paraquat-inducible protein A [Pontivivens ytuae]QPH52223.1 paraquat-inducible protein A [Pontivivens ytuae]
MTLLACPACDLLHEVPDLDPGCRARCARCGQVIVSGRGGSVDRMLAGGAAVAVLIVFALFFPFLSIEELGLSNTTTLIDITMAFLEGWIAPLALATAAAIVGLPLLRVGLLFYALMPLRLGRPRLRHAAAAFRTAESLRPWSMAEIFILGTAVALVKVVDIAQVGFGPAFWAFCAAVLIIALERTVTDTAAIWSILDDRS